MQIKSAVFVTSASAQDGCPPWPHPEVAFIGRSNVGKSSIINMLANKDGLAKVSATPGKTRLLNFFLINDSWSLVDLPGYGFAKVAKHEKYDFNKLAGDYLEQRPNLRRVYVLIDSRIPPQAIDLDFLAWLGETEAAFSLIFTKADKQSATKTQRNITVFLETMAQHFTGVPKHFVSSSKTRDGRKEILQAIGRDLNPPES